MVDPVLDGQQVFIVGDVRDELPVGVEEEAVRSEVVGRGVQADYEVDWEQFLAAHVVLATRVDEDVGEWSRRVPDVAAALEEVQEPANLFVDPGHFVLAVLDVDRGVVGLVVDDEQLDAIEKQMDAAGGVLEGRAMATTFNMLRSNDLIWSFVIDNYLKGKDPARFDLLFWNSDATRMPKKVHLFYLREFYQHNRLANGEMVMDDVTLDLRAVNIPIFMQAGETDHIAPHNSVYRTAQLYASGGNDKVQYMLAGSGHIAGVVNHPDKNKYHHSINTALPAKLDDWKASAERHVGSWWPYWIKWLSEVSPGKTDARQPGDGELDIIEDAPGSYVKVKA